MTINIIWAENKRNLSTHKTQTKTYNSSKEAIDWIRKNEKHIVSINHKGFSWMIVFFLMISWIVYWRKQEMVLDIHFNN